MADVAPDTSQPAERRSLRGSASRRLEEGRKNKSALADLAALRRQKNKRNVAEPAAGEAEDDAAPPKKLSRLDQHEMTVEEPIYEELNDAEYAALVAKRRAENGDFVVGEENLGYADIGEEEEWNVGGHDDDDVEEGGGPRKKGRAAQDLGGVCKTNHPKILIMMSHGVMIFPTIYLVCWLVYCPLSDRTATDQSAGSD